MWWSSKKKRTIIYEQSEPWAMNNKISQIKPNKKAKLAPSNFVRQEVVIRRNVHIRTYGDSKY